jgi:hypothetical protein
MSNEKQHSMISRRSTSDTMKPKNYKTVPDNHIRIWWKCKDCGLEITVEPTFAESSGNPVCEQCDDEMCYERTEVNLPASIEDHERLLLAFRQNEEEITQICGSALGYPRFCDDQASFPGTTPEDGVCVGEHVAVTIVLELADKYDRLLQAATKLVGVDAIKSHIATANAKEAKP